jgi:hypothetical protein
MLERSEAFLFVDSRATCGAASWILRFHAERHFCLVRQGQPVARFRLSSRAGAGRLLGTAPRAPALTRKRHISSSMAESAAPMGKGGSARRWAGLPVVVPGERVSSVHRTLGFTDGAGVGNEPCRRSTPRSARPGPAHFAEMGQVGHTDPKVTLSIYTTSCFGARARGSAWMRSTRSQWAPVPNQRFRVLCEASEETETPTDSGAYSDGRAWFQTRDLSRGEAEPEKAEKAAQRA